MEMSHYIKSGKINAFNHVNVESILASDNDYLVKMKEYKSKIVKDYLIERCMDANARISNGLKLVFLDESILEKNMLMLSSSEILKLELAILLINNVHYIVLFQFDQYFMEKELLYFKKLFKKLVNKYKKTIILVECGLDFMMNLVDRIVVEKENGKLEVFSEPDFYDEALLKYFEVPSIVSFIQYINHHGKNIKPYTDIKELIKAIYREV